MKIEEYFKKIKNLLKFKKSYNISMNFKYDIVLDRYRYNLKLEITGKDPIIRSGLLYHDHINDVKRLDFFKNNFSKNTITNVRLKELLEKNKSCLKYFEEEDRLIKVMNLFGVESYTNYHYCRSGENISMKKIRNELNDFKNFVNSWLIICNQGTKGDIKI